MGDALAGLFASGRIVDGLLVLVALEALALLAWRRARGHGPSSSAILCNLAAGAALMLALRAALTGADWTRVALCLLLALLAHGADTALRFRDRAASPDPAPSDPVSSDPVSLGRMEPIAGNGTSPETSALAGRS